MDFKQLKLDHPIDMVVEKYSGQTLKRKGSEWVGICPFHGDKEPSLMVNPRKKIFKCFVCGEGGDIFDFLKGYGHTLKECLEILEGVSSGNKEAIKTYVAPENRKEWVQVKPVPSNAAKADFKHYFLGQPSSHWTYLDADGKLLGYVLRYDGSIDKSTSKRKKEIRFMTYRTDGKRFQWMFRGFDAPRGLYNLQQFNLKKSQQVLIVEGEKAADKGTTLFNNELIVTTWQGGVEGVSRTDYSPLKDRVVYLWADNDISHIYPENHPKAGQLLPFEEQPGNRAMLELYGLIKDIVKKVMWIRNSPNFPDKWDIYDATWTNSEAQEYFRANVIDIPGSNNPAATDNITPAPPNKTKPKEKSETDNWPFKILGFENQESGPPKIYFFAYKSNSVVVLRPDQMKPENLMSIAPLQWWEKKFKGKREGMDKLRVIDTLVDLADKVGTIQFKDWRGRGAWIDKGRVVVHAGNHLIVDGKRMEFNKFNSRFIYQQSKSLDVDIDRCLNTTEAAKLLKLTELLNWERKANSSLLAGWIMVSPICGALNWRPHIWITGPAGSGKSTVMHQMVRPMIDNLALIFQGKTTEPGVRQVLKDDAVPILFDELDADGRDDVYRIQAILSLMRASSTNDGGLLSKGSSSQVARTFTTKACFCFASISVKTAAYSDHSRVSVLSLRANINDPAKKEILLTAINDLITPEYARQLQARAIKMIPIIVKNAATLAVAAAIEIGQQRTGDQVGALLAGSYALEHDGLIGLKEAREYVNSFTWEDERGAESVKDETMLLQFIMEQIIDVEDPGGIKLNRAVVELISIAVGHTVSDIPGSNCEERLRRMGIKTDGNYLVISNTSKHIMKMLEGTNWMTNYNKILMRLTGSVGTDATSFNSELKSRAVKIPLGLVTMPAPNVVKPKPKEEDPDADNNPTTYPGGSIVPTSEEDMPF